MNATRKQMRGTAEILMGKNTLMRKVMKAFLDKHPGHPCEALMPLVYISKYLPVVRILIPFIYLELGIG